MALGLTQVGELSSLDINFENVNCCTVADCERELSNLRRKESLLQEVLAQDEKLLHQKDDAINYQSLITKESDHRLLNEMQIVASLLSMQSRTSSNAETAEQLIIAANRVREPLNKLVFEFSMGLSVDFEDMSVQPSD